MVAMGCTSFTHCLFNLLWCGTKAANEEIIYGHLSVFGSDKYLWLQEIVDADTDYLYICNYSENEAWKSYICNHGCCIYG